MTHGLSEKVQEVLDRAVEAGTECGCQAALFIDGELAVNAYSGWTDWTKTKKVDENTIFPIFSTGKAISTSLCSAGSGETSEPADNVTQIFGHGGIGGSEALLDQKRRYAIAITRNVFGDPNVLNPFYSTVDFKNRDWPDPAELPEQIRKRASK